MEGVQWSGKIDSEPFGWGEERTVTEECLWSGGRFLDTRGVLREDILADVTVRHSIKRKHKSQGRSGQILKFMVVVDKCVM